MATNSSQGSGLLSKLLTRHTRRYSAGELGLQWVQELYDVITKRLQTAGRGGNKLNVLRYICDADNHVKNGRRNAFCG